MLLIKPCKLLICAPRSGSRRAKRGGTLQAVRGLVPMRSGWVQRLRRKKRPAMTTTTMGMQTPLQRPQPAALWSQDRIAAASAARLMLMPSLQLLKPLRSPRELRFRHSFTRAQARAHLERWGLRHEAITQPSQGEGAFLRGSQRRRTAAARKLLQLLMLHRGAILTLRLTATSQVSVPGRQLRVRVQQQGSLLALLTPTSRTTMTTTMLMARTMRALACAKAG